MRNPDEHLLPLTIFPSRRDYDPAECRLYWVKHCPWRGLIQTPDGVAMARQVAKGMDEACIACHNRRGDMVFGASRHSLPYPLLLSSG